MLFKTLLPATLCAFVAARAVEPLERSIGTSSLFSKTSTLADGTNMQYGNLPTEGLEWQASGVLLQGGCSPSTQYITDCFELELGNNPATELDPGFATPRQRIEFETPKQNDGTSWKYTWRSYLQSGDTGSNSFFHIMQIFSDTAGGPAYFLDILENGASFKNAVTGQVLATASLASILATPLQHTLAVTYGPSGRLSYTITNSQTGASILRYSAAASVGAGENYLKFGTYRAAYDGMPSLKSWYGDYTVQKA